MIHILKLILKLLRKNTIESKADALDTLHVFFFHVEL